MPPPNASQPMLPAGGRLQAGDRQAGLPRHGIMLYTGMPVQVGRACRHAGMPGMCKASAVLGKLKSREAYACSAGEHDSMRCWHRCETAGRRACKKKHHGRRCRRQRRAEEEGDVSTCPHPPRLTSHRALSPP